MDVKDLIKSRRAALELTLEDVARHVGVSSTTVFRWENGDIENMRRDRIAKLAEILKLSPADIMGWPETDEAPLSEEIVLINRAAKNMTDEQRKKLLDMAKVMFEEEFDDA